MSRRMVVNVATTERYQRGQARLITWLADHHEPGTGHLIEPIGCPKHSDVPYAFKAFALHEAANRSDLLLWADASIIPIRSLEPLWERIERNGYWISNNGWTNYEWTADSAYPDLFADHYQSCADTPPEYGMTSEHALGNARSVNRRIPHVVATAFGLNVRSEIGAAFLAEYYRLASETRAFCGPWSNVIGPGGSGHPANTGRAWRCGPDDVRGHRHDQTAASVIAWRLGMTLTNAPDVFAYRGGEIEQTILVADGGYE